MVILKLVSVHSKEEVEVVPSFPRNLQQETHILSDIDTVKSNEVFNVLQWKKEAIITPWSSSQHLGSPPGSWRGLQLPRGCRCPPKWWQPVASSSPHPNVTFKNSRPKLKSFGPLQWHSWGYKREVVESRGGEDSSPQNPSRSLHSSLINQGRKFLIAKEEAFCNRHDFFCAYRIGVRTHCVSLTAQIGGRCMLRFLQRVGISVEKRNFTNSESNFNL